MGESSKSPGANCEDCPMADVCGGDVGELAGKLLREHETLLIILTLMARARASDGILAAFVMGYLLHGTESQEDVQLDMDIWGECLGGEVR